MKTLRLERIDETAVVTLDRPPVNAVNHQMQVELRTVFDQLSEDLSVRAVVLAAAGEKAFCAGIDLQEGLTESSDSSQRKAQTNPGREWRATQHSIRHCSVPVIVAVENAAIGAGFGLVGVSDIIVASHAARFALTEINVGLLGGASKALHLVGPGKARMMLFSGQTESAEEFYRRGAIERLVRPGQARTAALEIAQEISAKSPIAMRLAKESVLRIETDKIEEQYRTEWDYTNRLRSYNDSEEAMSAYLEKRSANWTFS